MATERLCENCNRRTGRPPTLDYDTLFDGGEHRLTCPTKQEAQRYRSKIRFMAESRGVEVVTSHFVDELLVRCISVRCSDAVY